MEISNRTKVAAGLFIATAALLIGGGLGHKWQVIVAGSGFGVVSAIGLVWHKRVEAEKQRRSNMTAEERADDYINKCKREFFRVDRYVFASDAEGWEGTKDELFRQKGFSLDDPICRNGLIKFFDQQRQKEGKTTFYGAGEPIKNEDL